MTENFSKTDENHLLSSSTHSNNSWILIKVKKKKKITPGYHNETTELQRQGDLQGSLREKDKQSSKDEKLNW